MKETHSTKRTKTEITSIIRMVTDKLEDMDVGFKPFRMEVSPKPNPCPGREELAMFKENSATDAIAVMRKMMPKTQRSFRDRCSSCDMNSMEFWQ